jgi:hypothetical protein
MSKTVILIEYYVVLSIGRLRVTLPYIVINFTDYATIHTITCMLQLLLVLVKKNGIHDTH